MKPNQKKEKKKRMLYSILFAEDKCPACDGDGLALMFVLQSMLRKALRFSLNYKFGKFS
jgi:hypothetical protein